MRDTFQRLKPHLMWCLSLTLFVLFVSVFQPPDERAWKPLAYGAAIIAFLFFVHLALSANLNSKKNVLFSLFQVVITFVLLAFSISQKILIFIFFSIFLLTIIVLAMFLRYKRAKN